MYHNFLHDSYFYIQMTIDNSQCPVEIELWKESLNPKRLAIPPTSTISPLTSNHWTHLKHDIWHQKSRFWLVIGTKMWQGCCPLLGKKGSSVIIGKHVIATIFFMPPRRRVRGYINLPLSVCSSIRCIL